MTVSPSIHYRKFLTYAPHLDEPVGVYERLRFRLHDWLDTSHQPFELCMLAGNVVSLLHNRHGRKLALKDIQRLLRETTDFRDRFWKLVNRTPRGTEECPPAEFRNGAISIVYPYMTCCHEDFDAHVRALRHLWFGPTGDAHIDDDWYFDIAASARRQFLAQQFAMAALLYVDAAQLAAHQHRKGRDTVDYSLRGAHALRLAMEFNTLDVDQLRAEMARDAAVKRHRASPKAAAKTQVHGRYLNWKANREKHRSIAQFAFAMVNDFEVLESTQTVERWVRHWEKGKAHT